MVDVPPYNPANDLQFFQQGHVKVNSVPTHIITCGRWINEPLPLHEKLLVLVLPGNPGAIEYYKDFVCGLYEGLQRAVPVWAVSHAGHSGIPDTLEAPHPSENEGLYNLNGQIQHKIDFIQDYVPADRSLVLIGHSIGSYIILEIMKRLPHLKIIKSYLLFPTIERMASSPRGQWMSWLVNFLRLPALLGVYAASYIGESAQKRLISWYLRGTSCPDCVMNASMNMFKPDCVRAVMLMAKDEFDSVQALDAETIRCNLHRLVLYYGANDEWCPISYYHDMKEIFPNGDIKLCQNNFNHAFVINNSKEMAALVSAWISEGLLGQPRDIHAKSLLV